MHPRIPVRLLALLSVTSTCAVLGTSLMAGPSLLDRMSSGLRALLPASLQSSGGATLRESSPRQLAAQADAQRRNPALVALDGRMLDPLRDLLVTSEAPKELLAPLARTGPQAGTHEYWVVQHEGRAPAAQAEIEQAGGAIVGRIPNQAWLVRMEAGRGSTLSSLSSTRFATEWLPAWSVTAEVRQLMEDAGDTSRLPLDPAGRLRLGLHFFRTSSAAGHAELLGQLPGTQVLALEDREGSEPVALLAVLPEALHETVLALAALRDVTAILSEPLPQRANDGVDWQLQSGIDTIGSGDYDISAPLWRKGITGEGMLIGMTDGGLENDLCQFRYGSEVNEAAWMLGPDSLSPGAIPAEEDLDISVPLQPVRTRGRKVVAYYVQTNATAYEDDYMHGTASAAIMLGDANDVLAARPKVRDLGINQFVPPWNPAATWSFGQQLRPDLASRVDDPGISEPSFPTDFGTTVQHHASRDGLAPGAQLVVSDIGDTAGNLSGVFTGFSLLNQMQGTGATAHVAAFGGGGCTNCYGGNATGGDDALWRLRDIVNVGVAGNDGASGPGTIPSGYAHGKSTIVAGATEAATAPSTGTSRTGENVAAYSGHGPKSGGLLAPDLMAPGNVFTTTETGVQPEDGSGSGDGGCGSSPSLLMGTSHSGPDLTAAAVLVEQYFLDGFYPSGTPMTADALRPTNALVRAILTNSARDLGGARTNDDGSGSAHRPTYGQGWGMPRLDDTLYFAGDPKLDDPRGDTERARLIVISDTPNGYLTGTVPVCNVGRSQTEASPEPGGRLREDIVQDFRPAIQDGEIHESLIDVVNPDPGNPASELRFTLAWMDPVGPTGGSITTINDLDLEVVSPSGTVYRTSPLLSWTDGFTMPSPDTRAQTLPPSIDFPDRDPLNTLENVFIASADVEEGTWRVRVIGFDVPGNGQNVGDARPNYVDGDRPCALDADGDGTLDVDFLDRVESRRQGYALVASGNLVTTTGSLSLNQANFGCTGDQVVVTLLDANGDADRTLCDPDGDGTPLDALLTTRIETVPPSFSFPADVEVESLNGTQPRYQTRSLRVQITNDPTAVIHGNGILETPSESRVVVTYVDAAPCGATTSVEATASCRARIRDGGFLIEGGCEHLEPGNPASELRPDAFLDAGERDRYVVFWQNLGPEALTDATLSLVPDPTNPAARFVTVHGNPVRAGLAPPNLRMDAVFDIEMGQTCSADCDASDGTLDGIPPRFPLDFLVSVTSPADGLFSPATFTQRQILESDLESYRYDTRDANGELMGPGLIERNDPGTGELVTNAPMWFDPDADCDPGAGFTPCSEACDVSRDAWPAGGTMPPAGPCQDPAIRTGNPFNPWDFNDTDEGFSPAFYEGDANRIMDWYWKAAPDGGGCGWEDENDNRLASLSAGHPDRTAQPWGIWHTGAINRTSLGPFPPGTHVGAPASTVPGPGYGTIMWDSTPLGGANNTTGQWCNTYVSNPPIHSQYYRHFLVAPRLFRVHRMNPEFTVHFDELRFYQRLDGHVIDGDNTTVAGWQIHNGPVDPISVAPLSYTWSQFQNSTLIYTDDITPSWEGDDTYLRHDMRHSNPLYPELSYEDIYGPASDSWNFAFTWAHLNFTGRQSRGEYGWGLDDVSFVWTESREVADRHDCAPGANRISVTFDRNRYSACSGELGITVVDPNQTLGVIAVSLASTAEPHETALLEREAAGSDRFVGRMPFTTDAALDATGVLLVSGGSPDRALGADRISVEYDPAHASDHDPGDAGFSPEAAADWNDSDLDGANDDFVDNGTGAPPPDGIADAEDDDGTEVHDSATVSCPSGMIYVVRHRLQEATPGDGDAHADHGETQWMSVSLLSRLIDDLDDVTVRISLVSGTLCLESKSVRLDLLRGDDLITATTIDPTNADPMRKGFRFAVPYDVRTISLADPATVVFRVDVEGRNVRTRERVSTAGSSREQLLPQEVRLVLDVDSIPTAADFRDTPIPAPPMGTFRESFEGPGAALGLDHPEIPARLAVLVRDLDATTDTRFGVDLNAGFCRECDTSTECVVPDDCSYHYQPDTGTGDGYPAPSEWGQTQDWAKNGVGAYKFGYWTSPGYDTEHYRNGQFTTLEMPPLRVATDPLITPTLSFWHVADFDIVTFADGLVTPQGAGVIEVSSSAAGTPNRTLDTSITTTYPTSSFRRAYPTATSYDVLTDVLPQCATFFCRWQHPAFGTVGSRSGSPPSPADPRAGTVGPATWELTEVDLSEYRGQEIVVRLTVEVPQNVRITPGSLGWLIDDVTIAGLSNSMGLALQAGDPTSDRPCALVAEFVSSAPDCVSGCTQIFDRTEGVGSLTGGVPDTLSYEWDIAGSTIGPGLAGVAIGAGFPGIDPLSTYDAPRACWSDAGVTPGLVRVNERVWQAGSMRTSMAHDLLVKDDPVVTAFLDSSAVAGGIARFHDEVSYDAGLGSARTFLHLWNFGDGTPPLETDEFVASHVFADTGNYVVSVEARDEDGCGTSDTMAVTVGAPPLFAGPIAVLLDECADPATPGSITTDGNADIEETLTISLAFRNEGATASDVLGLLSSPDPYVEIRTGAADYGTVAAATTSAPRSFRLVRHATAAVPQSLPLVLTLLAEGRTFEQSLVFALPLGMVNDVPYDGGDPAPLSFCADSAANVDFVVPQGSANGLEIQLALSVTGPAFLDRLALDLRDPSGRVHAIFYPGEAPPVRALDLDFAFGADDSDPPIRNTGGRVEDRASTLPARAEDALAIDLLSTPMAGTWTLVARDAMAGDCATLFTMDLSVFRLEGTSSTDIELAVPGACALCTPSAPPIFDGAWARCTNSPSVEGRVQWNAALDLSTCGDSDVRYEVRASTVAGQAGSPPIWLSRAQTCADCPSSDCAFVMNAEDTYVDTCNVATLHWTIVAVDGTPPDARTPAVSGPLDAVSAPYQTELRPCASLPPGSEIRLMMVGGGLLLTPQPLPGIESFRIMRGSFPLGVNGKALMMGTRANPFDHVSLDCSFDGVSFDLSSDLSEPGSFYYLVASVNSAGCAGLGYLATPVPGRPGELEEVVPRPDALSGCPGTCGP